MACAGVCVTESSGAGGSGTTEPVAFGRKLVDTSSDVVVEQQHHQQKARPGGRGMGGELVWEVLVFYSIQYSSIPMPLFSHFLQ